MESHVREICRVADSWRKTMRKGPFASLKSCFGYGLDCLNGLGEFVDQSKQPSADHKKAMGAVRRSGIVEIALQHLLTMAKKWESDERKLATTSEVELSLVGTATVFKGTIRSSRYSLVDIEDAAKILAAIQEVSTMFHFERDSECPFPTFIFVDSLWLLVQAFPSLLFQDVGVHCLQCYVPKRKLEFKGIDLSDVCLYDVLAHGSWNR